MQNKNLHGGDLDSISLRYGIPKHKILNFSGNVNPLGLPAMVKEVIEKNADAAINYPDVDYTILKQSISSYTKAKSDNIIVGNGSTELISGCIKAVNPKKAILIAPAYSEYKRELRLLNSEIILFPLLEEDDFRLNTEALKKEISNDISLVVICNPNNPTGSTLKTSQIKELLEHCKKTDTFIMIDETYVEFSQSIEEISAVPLIDSFDNLFIIRGTSKFFSCPGLRLGYCITSNEQLKQDLLNKKDPWSVNIFAQLAGEVMFTDTDFIKKTRELIDNERQRIIDALLKIEDIKLFPTQSNFFLIKLLNPKITSSMIFDAMIKDKLLIRDTSSFEYLGDRFIRFCILLPEQNDLLIKKLTDSLKEEV